MATYAELLQASEDPGLNNKIRVAVIIAAEKIRTESPATTNHGARMAWAKIALSDPDGEARKLLWAVLAQNKDFALAAIRGATDAQVQTAVDAAVEVFL